MELIVAIELALLAGLMWLVLRKLDDIFTTENDTTEQLMELFDDLDEMSHDLQQIKTRLHWSRERELAKAQRDEFGFTGSPWEEAEYQIKKPVSRNKKSKK